MAPWPKRTLPHTMLAGGRCCVFDAQVRHRKRREDAAAEAAWPKRQHTNSGIRREDLVHGGQASERGKCEPRFHHRCRGRHQRQWSSPIKERRSRHARRTSGESPSRRDGTRPEYLEYELFQVPPMAVTKHSTFKSEWRDPRIWNLEKRKVLMENKVARTYVRRVNFEQWGLSEGGPGSRLLEHWPGATTSSQRSMPQED